MVLIFHTLPSRSDLSSRDGSRYGVTVVAVGERRTIQRKSRPSDTLSPSRQQWRSYLTARGHVEDYQQEYLWPLETWHNAALFRELQLIGVAFHWAQSTAVQDAGIMKENTSSYKTCLQISLTNWVYRLENLSLKQPGDPKMWVVSKQWRKYKQKCLFRLRIQYSISSLCFAIVASASLYRRQMIYILFIDIQ
jgi:hypothetical protein